MTDQDHPQYLPPDDWDEVVRLAEALDDGEDDDTPEADDAHQS